jgi:hypothetical protein
VDADELNTESKERLPLRATSLRAGSGAAGCWL